MKIKTVFITASSSGIGFLAKRYLDNNYKVIINGRNKKKLINASNKLNGCDFIISDMTSIKNIKSTITKIKKNINRLICWLPILETEITKRIIKISITH